MSKNKAALTFGILSVCCTCMIGGSFMLAKLMYDTDDFRIKHDSFDNLIDNLLKLGGETVSTTIIDKLKEHGIDTSILDDLTYKVPPIIVDGATGEITFK